MPGLDLTPELKETPKDKPKRGFVPVWGLQGLPGFGPIDAYNILEHEMPGAVPCSPTSASCASDTRDISRLQLLYLENS